MANLVRREHKLAKVDWVKQVVWVNQVVRVHPVVRVNGIVRVTQEDGVNLMVSGGM